MELIVMGDYIVGACLYRQLSLIGEASLLVGDLLGPLFKCELFLRNHKDESVVKETLDKGSLALMVGYPWERPNSFFLFNTDDILD